MARGKTGHPFSNSSPKSVNSLRLTFSTVSVIRRQLSQAWSADQQQLQGTLAKRIVFSSPLRNWAPTTLPLKTSKSYRLEVAWDQELATK